ncbi:(2Fe-2S)-binding protein [Peribacillus kribbensis]|uniref:(2Fe-2S)-binding protein n=1 Tax=Peribacillus kribbensis TaxID=356658 RepID=UPI00041C5D30|nr:(2Fe-2S)-binding protein [Peribacillus kribbensis]
MHQQRIWQELEQFNIKQNMGSTLPKLENLSAILKIASDRTKADTPHSMASVFIRNAAFIFVAQLYALSKFRAVWTGKSTSISMADHEAYGRWMPQWSFPDGEWAEVKDEEDVHSALKSIILQDGYSLIHQTAEATKSSRLVLWENVWGYALWMYTQLFQEDEEINSRARGDLDILLDDSFWAGRERTSPFKKFLKGLTPEGSMSDYARVTCCLYYLIPGNDKCPYCPMMSRDKCLVD